MLPSSYREVAAELLSASAASVAWTWDYRHFRPVAVDRGGGGVHLLVTEAEVPDP
jgi:hypothetical protein